MKEGGKVEPERIRDNVPHERPDFCRAWDRSVALEEQADPFCCSSVWQLSALAAFSPGRRVLAERCGQSVLVLAAAQLPSGQQLLTPLEAHWFFGCPLLGPDAVEMLADAVSVLAGRCGGRLSALLLGGMMPQSRTARDVLARFRSAFDIYLAGECVLAAASLEGGLDGFLGRRSANLRSNVRKAFRKAAGHGVGFERHCPADEAEADAVYAQMLAVELRSWKGLGHCGMAESPAREFYGEMLRRLAVQGTARVMFARHEGQDIGFIFGGMSGAIYRGQQFSYDAGWKDFSIGNLLQVEQIRWLCEDGATRYDMGSASGEAMAYKVHWTEQERLIQTWFLRPRHMRARTF